MSFAPGTRLGPYEIESLLGSGRFGEVYKRRDTRLGRTVALKVLLPVIAEDPTFRDRFEREARVISQLTHPHICTLYDVGHHEKTAFLVMEYLEGETLDARLKPRAPAAATDGTRGFSRALPLDEMLIIARQIADALACAHGAGIMHRDLKPANVFLTKNGVKLLDFGLAKAAVSTVGRGFSRAGADGLTRAGTAEAAPHQTMTAQGTILGTLQYMAPEQVEGLDTDSRVDIWAFGAILHEMITGKPAFEARTPATLIAAVLTQQPQPVRQAQPQTPRALERVIEGCLEKDREQRWQSIRDVGRQLGMVTAVDEIALAAAPAPATPSKPRIAALAGIAAVVLVVGAAVGFGLAGGRDRGPSSAPVLRFEIRPPSGVTIQHFADTSLYIAPSPDGSRVAFAAGGRLWIKALDRAKAEEVAGTNGGASPFWSPDGRALGFFAGGQLKKKVLDGGAPQIVCAVRGAGNNGAWNADGTILFDEWGQKRLLRVSADGGPATVIREGALDVGWPQFLPDGRHFLYANLSADHVSQALVGTLDGGESTPIAGVNSRAQYVAGYLLFRQDGALLAQPFDVKGLKLTGSPKSIAEFVTGFASTGFAAFSASGPDLLVYQAIAPANRLVWVDREGRDLETIGPPRDYASVRLSPDNQALAVTVRDSQLGTNDIWVHDFRRSIDSRLTTERTSENGPVWSPDGRTIVYGADRRGPPHIHARELGGSDEREITAPSTAVQGPTAVTPDGRFVVYVDANPETGQDVMLAPLQEKGPPVPLVHTKAREIGGRPSPDGKWLAYASNESGRFEVYVRPFQDGQRRWQVSRAGGANAKWRGDGRELFYVEGGARIMSVEVSPGAALDVTAPRVLFSREPFNDYDVTADGRRFVFTMLDPEAETGTLSAILNWTALLRK